ncbi:MAG: threonine synthase, partial [Bacteroidota bacterium]
SFISTRAQGVAAENGAVGFTTALLKGLAPDGGLFVPSSVPALPNGWSAAASLSEVATHALTAWLGHEFEQETIAGIAADALNFDTPVVHVADQLYVLELFHGPTLSFKDVGARTMARFMANALSGREEHVTILVATSGDTGSAVADGFAGQGNIDVVLLYPKGRVSEVQERQLIVERPNVRAFSVEGTFDDCQRMVKEAFADPRFERFNLSSANSINIGRLLPQMSYYLWAGIQLGEPALVCVPSGNLGNLTAGMLASDMGWTTNGFLAAHNANPFFPDVLAGHEERQRGTVQTASNAMDVGRPSNYERLRWLYGIETLQRRVAGSTTSDAETFETMRRVYEESGYVADPHTAVGIRAVEKHRAQSGYTGPALVLATAHPAKFPDALSEAGLPVQMAEALEVLREKPQRVQSIQPSLSDLLDRL